MSAKPFKPTAAQLRILKMLKQGPMHAVVMADSTYRVLAREGLVYLSGSPYQSDTYAHLTDAGRAWFASCHSENS